MLAKSLNIDMQERVEKRFKGDDWTFEFTIYTPSNAQVAIDPALENCETSSSIEIIPSENQTTADLTGFQFIARLFVGNKSPIIVTTLPQDDMNLLKNGRFTIVVPSSITSTLPADPGGSLFARELQGVRLQVTQIDSYNYSETIIHKLIQVVAP